MSSIPIYLKEVIQQLCDLNKNGKIDDKVNVNGSTYNEKSIFLQAQESFDSETCTATILGKKINLHDAFAKIMEPVKREFEKRFKHTEQPDALAQVSKQIPEIAAAKTEENKNLNEPINVLDMLDPSDPLYFNNQLKSKDWAKKFIEDNSRDKTVAKNLKEFEPYFEAAAKKHGVPKNVLKGICMKETTYGCGIKNVMQILGAKTYKELNMTAADANNPETCIMKAAELLKKALDKANGNIAQALVGYNAGMYTDVYKNWVQVSPNGYADKVLSFALAFDELEREQNNI